MGNTLRTLSVLDQPPVGLDSKTRFRLQGGQHHNPKIKMKIKIGFRSFSLDFRHSRAIWSIMAVAVLCCDPIDRS